MERSHQSEPVASVQLAKALLGAWLGGESAELNRELDRSAHTAIDHCAAEEEERIQLLQSIAVRMRSYGDLVADEPMDPALVLCVDLLLHLAQPADAIPHSMEQRRKNRRVHRMETVGVLRLSISSVH